MADKDEAPTPIAIVDCNNFYASCERVFEPALRVIGRVVSGLLGYSA